MLDLADRPDGGGIRRRRPDRHARWPAPSACARSASRRSSATRTSCGPPAPTRFALVVDWVAATSDRAAGRQVTGSSIPDGPAGAVRRAIVLADGDVPDRAALDASLAGLVGRRRLSSSRPTGAPATPPPRPADRSLGRRRRLDRPERDSTRCARRASRSTSCPPTRTKPTRSWRSPPPSARAPTRSTILGAFGGRRLDHALANLTPARPSGARRPARGAPGRRGPGPAGPRSRAGRRTGRHVAAGPDRRSRLADSVRRRCERITDRRSPLPTARRDARPRLGPRPVQRPPRRRMRRSISDAADSSSSRPLLRSRHEHADGRRPGTRGRARRRVRRGSSPLRPGRPMDDPLLLPEGRHARLHGRGVRVPRRQRNDHRARRRRLGRQPAGRGQQARVHARSSTFRSRSSPTSTTRPPRPTARGSRSRTTARPTGGRRGRRSSSTQTGGSRGPGRRSSPKATPPRSSRPWPKSRQARAG